MCAAFVLLTIAGVLVQFTLGSLPAALLVTLGPTCIILGFYYYRYAASTFKSQICYTFCEAVCWLIPLMICIGFFDPWLARVAGEPYMLQCSWQADAGGKVLVHALSFAAHCHDPDLFGSELTGRWDDLPCEKAPLGIGNGTVPVPSERGCLSSAALDFLEGGAVEGADGTRCPGFEETVPDALGEVCVESIGYMGSSVAVDSNKSLGRAFDTLFPGGALCKKMVYEDQLPAYDFCRDDGTCLLSPGDRGECRSESLKENVTITFNFNKTTVPHAFVMAYFRAAFLEETLKYLGVRRILFKDRAADSGALLVYGLAAAAGFATIENLQYTMMGGIAASYARMLTSIPLHCCTGLMIGIHLGYRKFLGKGYVCADGSLPCVGFLSALWMPVFIHGTWDVVLMIPQDAGFPWELRIPLALLTLISGFVYCRYAWMGIENVCVVHVKDLEEMGRVSHPRFCCCEPDCCRGYCVTNDPLADQEAGSDASSSDNSDQPGLVHALTAGPSGALLPPAPPCQTRGFTCPSCGAAVRVHKYFPSDCPFCGHEFEDPDPEGLKLKAVLRRL